MAAVSIAAALLWSCGAAIVLTPLLGPAARELAAELRAAARLFHRLTQRNDRR
jgi:hypothetical protein